MANRKPLPPHLLKRMEKDPDVLDKDRVSTAVFGELGIAPAQRRALVMNTKCDQNKLVAIMLDLCPINTGFCRAHGMGAVTDPCGHEVDRLLDSTLPGITNDDDFTLFVYIKDVPRGRPRVWVIRPMLEGHSPLMGSYTLMVRTPQSDCTVTPLGQYMTYLGYTFQSVQDKLQELL